MKKLLLVISLFISSASFAQSGASIKLTVRQHGETPVDSVFVKAWIKGTTDTLVGLTDTSGGCRFKPIRHGVYMISVAKPGYISSVTHGVVVSDLRTTYVTITITPVPSEQQKKSRRKNRR